MVTEIYYVICNSWRSLDTPFEFPESNSEENQTDAGH